VELGVGMAGTVSLECHLRDSGGESQRGGQTSF